MRTLIINLLATGLLLFGASSASAFALYATLNPGSSSTATILAPSSLVILDVYLDADPGLGFLAVALTWDDDGILNYEPGASSMPSYVLYNYTSKGVTQKLVPNVNPPGYWNGINVPGKVQINIEYLEPAFNSTGASGTGIWLATIVFHVAAIGDGLSTIDLTLNANGTIVEAFTLDEKGNTPTTGTFTVETIPEPTTALLIGFGLVGLALAGRRQD